MDGSEASLLYLDPPEFFQVDFVMKRDREGLYKFASLQVLDKNGEAGGWRMMEHAGSCWQDAHE